MLLGFQQVRELPKHSAFGRRKEKKREKKMWRTISHYIITAQRNCKSGT